MPGDSASSCASLSSVCAPPKGCSPMTDRPLRKARVPQARKQYRLAPGHGKLCDPDPSGYKHLIRKLFCESANGRDQQNRVDRFHFQSRGLDASTSVLAATTATRKRKTLSGAGQPTEAGGHTRLAGARRPVHGTSRACGTRTGSASYASAAIGIACSAHRSPTCLTTRSRRSGALICSI